MKEILSKLIESLRQELQHYGEMLALLDQQQDQIVVRAASDLVTTVAAINAQAERIQSARTDREQDQRALAHSLEHPRDSAFLDLLPRVPEVYRPLLQALIEENNALLVRVQQRARQNHLLLNRSLELMQKLMSNLIPSTPVTTYTGGGRMANSAASGAHTIYDAVG